LFGIFQVESFSVVEGGWLRGLDGLYAEYFFVLAGVHGEGAVEVLRNALGISGVLKNCLAVLDMAGGCAVDKSVVIFGVIFFLLIWGVSFL